MPSGAPFFVGLARPSGLPCTDPRPRCILGAGTGQASTSQPSIHQEAVMPLYIIERNFAEQLELDADGVVAIKKINGEIGVNWVFSFLSADKRKTYCLYEAKDAEAIREAARRAKVPADEIVEVTQAFGDAIAAAGRGGATTAAG
jgi:hypothetical protein